MIRKFISACFVFCAVMALSTPNYHYGKWSVQPLGRSDFRLVYNRHTLIQTIAFRAFEKNYSTGKLMFDTPPDVSPDNSSYRWCVTSTKGKAELILTLAKDEATVEFKAKIPGDDPAELGFVIPVNPHQLVNQELVLNRGTVSLLTPFRALNAQSLTLKTLENDYLITNLTPEATTFILQDKRTAKDKVIRFIANFGRTDKDDITLKVSIKPKQLEAKETARRTLFKTSPIKVVTNLSISNPGFEEDFSHWNHPHNASLDRKITHSGNASAKLVVKDPLKEPVYITRKIPVRAGAEYVSSCFVKTDNVRFKDSKQPSVGAGLIIEWSDKNGKWLTAGEYACKLFGTQNWKKMVTSPICAPEQAGYAEVFLAVRGTGTAWFDDFAMTEIRQSVQKLAPLHLEDLKTNTPLLRWKPFKGAGNYSVLLSQSADFTPATTQVFNLDDADHFQVTSALAPGTWFWKVTAKGAEDMQPWSFTHHMPQNQDCLPPTINFTATRLTAPAQDVKIRVLDENHQKPKVQLKLEDQILTPKTIRQENDGYVAVFQPAEGWPQGFHQVEISAADPQGNRATQKAWILNAPKPVNPVVIDRNGQYSTNGKVIFPLGIYEVRKPDMLEVRNIGFDAVHTYRWEGSRDDVACRQYLDDCWKANRLRAFIGFDRKAICNGEFQVIAQRVAALASHPGLFCWYLFDEPEIQRQYVSPERLTAFADLIRALDPYHAVVMTTWGKGMNRYRKTWDTHWSQAYFTPDKILMFLDQHRNYLHNQSPITLLIHCYDKQQSPRYRADGTFDARNFKPDYDWLRGAAFTGITQNVNGLWWWWFARHVKTTLAASKVPEAWNNVAKVIREIKSLEPFLVTTPQPNSNGRLNLNGQTVLWCVRQTQDRRLVIIVNTSDQPVTINATINHSLPAFKLTLKRFGVHTQIFPRQ